MINFSLTGMGIKCEKFSFLLREIILIVFRYFDTRETQSVHHITLTIDLTHFLTFRGLQYVIFGN